MEEQESTTNFQTYQKGKHEKTEIKQAKRIKRCRQIKRPRLNIDNYEKAKKHTECIWCTCS